MRRKRPGSCAANIRAGFAYVYIAATPNPRATKSAERGTQVPWGESRGESAGGAGSFSASPSANPAGRRKRTTCGLHYLILPSIAALALALRRRRAPPGASPARQRPRAPPDRRHANAPAAPASAPRPAPRSTTGRTRPSRVSRRKIIRGRRLRARRTRRSRCSGRSGPANRSGSSRTSTAAATRSFNDAGYDCSGSVSYVLHAAGLLSTPMDSSEFMSWGQRRRSASGSRSTPTPATRSSRSPGSGFDTSAERRSEPASGLRARGGGR